MHDVDGEVHLVRVRFEARRNRIHSRQKLRQRVDKILRRPFDRRMLDQKIDDLHSPKIFVEVQLSIGTQKLCQQRRTVDRALGNCLQKLRRCLGNSAIAKEHFTQSLFASRPLDCLIAFRANLTDNFIHQRRIVGCPDRH